MKRQCPECKTVAVSHMGYCMSCGYRFFAPEDKVRQMAARPKKQHGVAVMAGLAIAIVQYMLRR